MSALPHDEWDDIRLRDRMTAPYTVREHLNGLLEIERLIPHRFGQTDEWRECWIRTFLEAVP